MAALVPAAGQSRRLLERRPRPGIDRPGQRLRSDLAQVRANISLDSPAGRHAVRLAVVVLATELLAKHLPLQRSYWMVVAAAMALAPEFGATFTRGAERILGTCAGVAIAGVIAVTLHPGLGATVPIVALLAWTATLFPAGFAVGFTFITALIVFLLEVVSPDTLTTATHRLVDTLVGGTIALLAYLAWPTWSHKTARQALADAIGAQRRYLGAILRSRIDGIRARESQTRPLARATRLARTDAESAVARSLAEPTARRIDPGRSQATFSGLRRLVEATQVLRVDAEPASLRAPVPTLAPLADGIDRGLEAVESITGGEPPTPAEPHCRRCASSTRASGMVPMGGPRARFYWPSSMRSSTWSIRWAGWPPHPLRLMNRPRRARRVILG